MVDNKLEVKKRELLGLNPRLYLLRKPIVVTFDEGRLKDVLYLFSTSLLSGIFPN